MDLADLSEEKLPPKFVINSERLGELGFRRLYGIDFPYLKETTRGSDSSVIGLLLQHIGWRVDGLEPLSEAHLPDLTASDLEAFCRALVEHEPTVFEGTERRADEVWLAYVRRAGAEAVKTRKGPFENSAVLDMEDTIERSLKLAGLDPVSLALSRNIGAASDMQSLLDVPLPQFEMPILSRSPIADTNAILGRVEEQISRMAVLSEAGGNLQKTLNDYAQKAIADMTVGAKRTERNAKLALRVGLAGIVTGVLGTLVAVGTWIWTADQQGKAEAMRKVDAEVASVERNADREIMLRQLEAMQASADPQKR